MIKVRIQRTYIEASLEELLQIEKAFSLSIDRFEHAVRDVEVTLVDVNGPRGGVDKRCCVQVRVYPRGLVVVRSTGSVLMDAVNEACDKMRQVIAKRLSKKKSLPRRHTVKLIEEGVSYGN